ncbi:hypothetical protein GWI33_011171, partial [Rhynchophorus ferrugineus]
NNPTEARQMLLQNPQLAYALLQAQVVMKIIDPHTASTLLHPVNQVPATLMPGDKNVPVQVPINNQFQQPPPAPVAPPRQEFQPVPAPVMPPNSHNAPVFTGQDVDLRSMGNVDPRLSRMADQDMRQMPPAQLSNPLPPPVAESLTLTKSPEVNKESFPRETRDPRDPRNVPAQFPIDPRQAARGDPRQKNMSQPPPSVPPPSVRPPAVSNNIPPPIANLPPRSSVASAVSGATNPGTSDQEKAALIMQVLQLSDEQIAMLPPEQRTSILVLKEQIAKSAQGR